MPAEVLTARPGWLALPGVSLAAVTSVALEATARAVECSLAGIDYAEALWISDAPPPGRIAGRVRWERIARLDSREAYSRFMVRELADHVRTGHVLCVQWDGYVLDPAAWDPAFLETDYVGAVWPQFADGMTVGNGGFSLRSRRLLEAARALPDPGGAAEDVFLCRTMRPVLERDHAIRFAEPALAARFAFERQDHETGTFGFHGSFNLIRMIDDAAAARLLADLPGHALAASELREMLGWALRHGRWRVAREIARRWRRWCRVPGRNAEGRAA